MGALLPGPRVLARVKDKKKTGDSNSQSEHTVYETAQDHRRDAYSTVQHASMGSVSWWPHSACACLSHLQGQQRHSGLQTDRAEGEKPFPTQSIQRDLQLSGEVERSQEEVGGDDS